MKYVERCIGEAGRNRKFVRLTRRQQRQRKKSTRPTGADRENNIRFSTTTQFPFGRRAISKVSNTKTIDPWKQRRRK